VSVSVDREVSKLNQLDAIGLLVSLMRNVPGAIYRCALDEDWTMQLIGDEIERISGYPASDFLANACRSFSSIIHPDDRDEVDAQVRAAVDAGEAFSLEYRIVRADGELRWVLERGLRGGDSEGGHWLDGVIFDVTDRRRAEDVARRREAEAARVAELEASRARIVEATDATRRRLERDLHDGAQQRLVSAALALRLAQNRSTDPQLSALLEQAGAELTAGLDELRELARGIHPALLTDRGLPGAVAALAGRCAVPVTVDVALPERPVPAVESAIYFTIAEALTNVTKYADATAATVHVSQRGDLVRLEVRDDGRGGATPAAGSGLQGLADRLAALGGELVLDSPADGGTVLRARLPMAGRSG
jgi:PAS domain S-box-containing protein